MSDTRIDPEEFLDMSPSKYFRLLEKDLARLSKKTGYKDYTVIQKFRFDSKKQTVFLFASSDDKDWEDVLEKAKERGKRFASGECKVVEVMDRNGDGDEDITIGIKTANGDINKFKVTELINEEVFEDDDDVEAVLIKEMDERLEEDQEAKEKIRNERIASGKKNHAGAEVSPQEFIQEMSTNKEGNINAFLEQYKKTFEKSEPKTILKNFQTKANATGIQNKNLLNKLNELLEKQLDEIYRTLELGKTWYNNSSDPKSEDLKKLTGGHLQLIKRLARRLERIQEGVEEKLGI